MFCLKKVSHLFCKRKPIKICKAHFLFNMYWKFDEEEMMKLKQSKITRNDRNKVEQAQYLEIPINLLIDF